MVRESEVFYLLNLIRNFDSQDKMSLWAHRTVFNGIEDNHTLLYRATQTHMAKQAVLAKISVDKNLINLMLKNIDNNMLDLKYKEISKLSSGLDIIQYKLNLLNENKSAMEKAHAAIVKEFCPTSPTLFFDDDVLLHKLRDALLDCPNLVSKPDYTSNTGIDPQILKTHKFTATENWILSLQEAEQTEALAELEFLAHYNVQTEHVY